MVVNTDLWLKCLHSEVEQIREALDSGADPNSTMGGAYSTLLMAAVLNNREEVVDLLLATDGIEVNKREGGRGDTALHLACRLGRDAIISKLLAAPGIDINALDNLNLTPIMSVLDRGRTVEAVEAVRLMAAAANLDCKFPDGQSLEERCDHRSAKNLIKIWWKSVLITSTTGLLTNQRSWRS